MDFKKVDKKYRPIPFWSWNEKLDTKETRRQVVLMDEAGIGGFFMHARGGLLTPYMEKEWFDNVEAAVSESEARGMGAWAYDENGWPSGFGGGKVNGKGEFYQQKYLGHAPEERSLPEGAHRITAIRGEVYYYLVNPYYVDNLDPDVVRDFIHEVYEVYYRRFGNRITGIFTDEPQLMNGMGAYPWSNRLADLFFETYGYSLTERLNELYYEEGDYRRTRFDFWRLVTRTFSESYFKQIYDFCEEHGYAFTGHLMMEDDLGSQLVSSGAAMPHYEYFTVPGMDWLGRPVRECLTPMQLGSACAQLGKKQILSETFALCGHNVSHDELKRIYEWQMVRGVNLLCTHLEGYSLRGIRKRDYPPAMYYQQPWWEDMNIFFDATSRIGMLLAEGQVSADVLLVHPQSTAWIYFDGSSFSSEKLNALQASLLSDMRTLERKHVLYHLGDETLMERHARVENGKLILGNMAYSTLILPAHEVLFENTERLIAEFRAQGGKVLTAAEVPANPMTDADALTYTMRDFPDFRMHYFVNTGDLPCEAKIPVGTLMLDAVTGDLLPFAGHWHFEPYESLVVIEDKTGRMTPDRTPAPLPAVHLSLPDTFRVREASYNSVTLDRCDYSFDGGEVVKDAYVLDILPRLNELRRPVCLTETFRVMVEEVPAVAFLCMEMPTLFEIRVNGKRLEARDAGFFRDTSFRLLPVADLLRRGENEIVLSGIISQREETYRHLSHSWTCETMKNSLAYDEEVEQIYIVGDFGTAVNETPEECGKDAYRIRTAPRITAKPQTVTLSAIDRSGFAQFAGTLVLEGEVDVTDTARLLEIEKGGINSLGVAVNGRDLGTRMFPPYVYDLQDVLTPGKNTVTLTLRGNLRNMQGPFHLKEGESYFVTPASFYRESNIFNHKHGAVESCHDVLPQWDNRICLCHMWLKSK